ncbi:MAG: signal peptidase II [candidate division KSB1 bacterium]|nr:signal peptidase II [candidate division KSB1 bacterium]MDZ7303463.1 signal peptidase II [candidate division KSB1 bacterium]MDZ7312545.1 signal peptidase II [candidate division KSB1 bacterium]
MWILVFTLLVVALDQISKIAIKTQFDLKETVAIIGNFLQFTYIQNEGMAFGIRFGNKFFFTIFASIASAIILLYLYRIRNAGFFPRFSLALILGGALGNLIDRFAYGAVIDFIDIGVGTTRWPVFNIADSAVTIGMIILISLVLFEKSKEEAAPPASPFPLQQPAPSDEHDNWRDVQRTN